MVKIGNPVEQIVATAQEGNFDLIIMGTHGHGKMEERIIGSTASDVHPVELCTGDGDSPSRKSTDDNPSKVASK
jgi:hypothetical protein